MTVRELLANIDADELKVMIRSSVASNVIDGNDIPDTTMWRFCDVMDMFGQDMMHVAIRSIARHNKMTEDEVLKCKASEFVSYLRWLQDEAEKIGKLMDQLKKEPDPDMINSGVDKMDRYGVVAIYYGITKDPTQWDRISEAPFHMMYTKLMIDKDSAEIQQNYNRLMAQKHKR